MTRLAPADGDVFTSEEAIARQKLDAILIRAASGGIEEIERFQAYVPRSTLLLEVLAEGGDSARALLALAESRAPLAGLLSRLSPAVDASFSRAETDELKILAFQDALIEIAKDDDLTLEPTKVLMYLFGQLSFENYLHISQKDIAEALGIDKANVSKAMKLLAHKGIILDGPKVGRMKTYRLSPDLGWKGKVTSLNDYRRSQLRVITGGKDAA